MSLGSVIRIREARPGEDPRLDILLEPGADVETGDLLHAQDTCGRYLLEAACQYTAPADVEQFVREVCDQALGLAAGIVYPPFALDALTLPLLVARVVGLLENEGTVLGPPRRAPAPRSTVRAAEPADLAFLSTGRLYVGDLTRTRGGRARVRLAHTYAGGDIKSILVVGATRRGKTNLLQLLVQQALRSGAFGILAIDPTGELCAPQGAIRRAARSLGQAIVVVSNRLTTVVPEVTLLPLRLARSEVGPGDLKRTIPDIEDAQVRFIDLVAREFPQDWLARLDGDTPDLRRADGSEVRSGANVQTTIRVCYYARRLARLVSPLHAPHGPLIPTLRHHAQAGRVVLIDLAGEGDRSLQSAFQRLCAARLFAQLHEQRLQAPAQFAAAKSFYMTVDEAHRFFDHDAAVGESTFALIAREGNRNKMGLCLLTQLPSDLPHEAYANTGITMSFALPSAREREHFARNAPTDIGVLEAELRDLPVGEAIVAASGLRLALHVRLPRADQVAALLERRVLAPATSSEEGA